MGFSCAPPCVWPSPGSRGASFLGAIAAAQGRVPGRGLKGERRRQRHPEPHRGGWDWGTASGFTVSRLRQDQSSERWLVFSQGPTLGPKMLTFSSVVCEQRCMWPTR
ncbi:hypothetical protein MJT46_015819 [Ovis ammon polii x Ovis aries]|nr:hypothetical protein MJT46_015819 [Ovis ammon polii x Ovis aries]